MRMSCWYFACDEGTCQESLIYRVPFGYKERIWGQNNEMIFSLSVWVAKDYHRIFTGFGNLKINCLSYQQRIHLWFLLNHRYWNFLRLFRTQNHCFQQLMKHKKLQDRITNLVYFFFFWKWSYCRSLDY